MKKILFIVMILGLTLIGQAQVIATKGLRYNNTTGVLTPTNLGTLSGNTTNIATGFNKVADNVDPIATGLIYSKDSVDYKFINKTIKNTVLQDAPTATVVPFSAWTSAGWTGDAVAGWSHTSGNTSVLSNTMNGYVSSYYIISYTVTNWTIGSFTLGYAGVSIAGISATGTKGFKGVVQTGLTITPTSDFNGTIVISVKIITSEVSPVITFKNSSGVIQNEIRSYGTNGIAIGVGSARYSIGSNITIGYQSGYQLISGGNNTVVGSQAGFSLSYQNGNSFFGSGAGYFSNLGFDNTALGASAANSLTSGSKVVAIGASSASGLTTGSTGVYVGHGSSAGSTSAANEIVLGFNATGAGSNTATLGNTSITDTYLRGILHLNVINTAPVSATATGVLGEIRITATGIYICTSTNTWIKCVGATF